MKLIPLVKSATAAAIGGNDEREQTLNQLLTEMDGFDGSKGVVILAATNRPESLDTALLRPGRFDRRIPVELPDLQGREAILRLHAKGVQLDANVDLSVIARMALRRFRRGAGQYGQRGCPVRGTSRAGKIVQQSDLEESVEVVIAGYQKQERHFDGRGKAHCQLS